MALKEQLHIRQNPGELRRRWFLSDQFDLILWVNVDGSFAGFELCYDRGAQERLLIWRPESGFSHMSVDDGEHSGRNMDTPLLVADKHFDAERVCATFAGESRSLPDDVTEYVLGHLKAHPALAPAGHKEIV